MKKYTEKQLINYETLGGTPHLDGEYTVFGEVIRGLDVIEKYPTQKLGKLIDQLKMFILLV